MSMVRVNAKIKEEVTPILSDLGISLGEAVNMFLHQVKLNNGIPFELKRNKIVELNDGFGSYICDSGQIHDYSEVDLNALVKEAKAGKSYKNAKEMMDDVLEDNSK